MGNRIDIHNILYLWIEHLTLELFLGAPDRVEFDKNRKARSFGAKLWDKIRLI